MKKKLFKEVSIQGLRLKQDDILVAKYPVDNEGYPIYDFESMQGFHKMMSKNVKCSLMSLPENITFTRIRKDEILYTAYKNKKKRSNIRSVF